MPCFPAHASRCDRAPSVKTPLRPCRPSPATTSPGRERCSRCDRRRSRRVDRPPEAVEDAGAWPRREPAASPHPAIACPRKALHRPVGSEVRDLGRAAGDPPQVGCPPAIASAGRARFAMGAAGDPAVSAVPPATASPRPRATFAIGATGDPGHADRSDNYIAGRSDAAAGDPPLCRLFASRRSSFGASTCAAVANPDPRLSEALPRRATALGSATPRRRACTSAT
jgi:hypothetical protein